MKEAIQKAIEGGWKPKHWMYGSGLKTETIFEDTYLVIKDGVVTNHLQYSEVREDPLFWQALGKAMGWTKKHDFGCYSLQPGGKCDCVPEDLVMWYWHRFIDHLAEGKDAEGFFKELLK